MPSPPRSPGIYRSGFSTSSALYQVLCLLPVFIEVGFYLLCTIPSPLSSPGIYRSGFLLLHYVKSSALSRYLSKLILRFLYCVKSSVFSGYSLLRVFCLFCTMPSPLPSPGIYRKGFSLISMSLFLFLCLFFLRRQNQTTVRSHSTDLKSALLVHANVVPPPLPSANCFLSSLIYWPLPPPLPHPPSNLKSSVLFSETS